MDSDPFVILGLHPATCDEAAIKSAYARLLKLHRPDRDPVGFRRIRDAYEFCRSSSGTAYMAEAREPLSAASETETTEAEVPLSEPVAGASVPAPAKPQQVIEPFATNPLPFSPHPPSPPPRPRAVDLDDLDVVLQRYYAGDSVPLQQALSHWEQQCDWPRLRQLGELWLLRMDADPASGMGEVALMLAHRLALLDGGLASKLADAGFQLASGTRERLVHPELDLLLHVGRHLDGLAAELRGELMTALSRGDLKLNAPDFARRLRGNLAKLASDRHVQYFLRQRIPLAWDAPPSSAPSGSPRRPTRSAPSAPKSSSAWGWVVAMVVLGLLRLVFSSHSTPTQRQEFPQPTYVTPLNISSPNNGTQSPLYPPLNPTPGGSWNNGGGFGQPTQPPGPRSKEAFNRLSDKQADDLIKLLNSRKRHDPAPSTITPSAPPVPAPLPPPGDTPR